jgi:hypothetical protein
VKHARLTMTVAVSMAMMMPTGIFAECCCSAAKVGCCAVKTPAEVPKASCCSCEQKQVGESSRECVTPQLGNRVRPSCECCLRVRLSSTAVPVRLKNDVAPQSILGQQPSIDYVLQQSSTKYIEPILPVLSHNKRQALLCVWIN